MGTKARIGLATLLLLVGGAACGDDSDSTGVFGADGSDPADGGAGGGTGAGGGGPCELLEVSEIEAEFGDQGAVTDGEALGISCSWTVGAGTVVVTRARYPDGTEEPFAEVRGAYSDATEVQGIGDEAISTDTDLWFRTGDQVLSLSVFLDAEVAGMQDKLSSLAQQMLDRV